ncbi:ABC transporter permease subunit [Allorhodopirellula heiligendammensis]|uniref:Inner membrane transport permease YbhR n=1 Tax=Allorhodopirellula heiligendammensis TaxID=2714739 RepID=A0A5C6BGM3_9BACT|nr:ABC transporter permease subunit [Allorhodopirellula heiligendammensis]TWU10419.1 Inner membrane transport permease YbhR [Allorhodopirellula heiligendammensis]
MINPLIQRELYGILRSPRAMIVLMCLTFAFSISVLTRWPADASVDLSGIQSLEVFRVFGYGLLAGVVFLVPAFPATSVVNEKNQGTLALLLNSPLTAFSIYFGKISGVLLFSVLVLLCSLPASAACFAMGGISLTGQLGLLYLILMLLVIQYATLGMLVSSYVQTADAGVRITYTIVLGMCFLTLVPAAFFPGADGAISTLASWLRNLSPIPSVMEIMRQGDVGSAGLKATSATRQFIVVTLLSSGIFASITLSRFNYRIFDRSRAKGVITHERGRAARTARRLFYLIDPQRRKRGIPWYLNPVMVKEFRCRKFGRSQWLLRLISVCAVASVLVTFAAATSATSWGVETIGGLMVMLQVVLVVVLTPSLASGLISGEREGSGWELLRLTPLSPFRIVSGKILSVAWTLGLVLMATLPGYLMMILIQPVMWLQVNLVLVCLVWTAIEALSLSAAIGSLFRSTAVSTTAAYVAVIAVFLTPMLVWLGRDAPFGHDAVQTVLLATPVGAALNVIGAPGFENYDLLPLAWWVAGSVSALMLGVLGLQVWRLSRAV